MKRIIYYLIIVAGMMLGMGCKKDRSPMTPSTTAELRIFNSTPWIFYNCTIDPTGTVSDNPGPDAHDFGQVEINERTNYKTFPRLYRYSWVRLTMNSKTYYLKPYNYTSETALESGRYTYKLTYTSMNDQLKLELVKD